MCGLQVPPLSGKTNVLAPVANVSLFPSIPDGIPLCAPSPSTLGRLSKHLDADVCSDYVTSGPQTDLYIICTSTEPLGERLEIANSRTQASKNSAKRINMYSAGSPLPQCFFSSAFVCRFPPKGSLQDDPQVSAPVTSQPPCPHCQGYGGAQGTSPRFANVQRIWRTAIWPPIMSSHP